MVLITTTKKFMQFAQSASSGTTGRQRIDESKFLDTKIPLPKLDIQKQIVDKISNSQNNLNNLKLEYQKYILHFKTLEKILFNFLKNLDSTLKISG